MNRDVGVSVIIPFRNEAAQLPFIIASLEGQRGVVANIEVIWVDDASEDDGASMVMEAVDRNAGWKYLLRQGLPGKKSAIHTGILSAQFDCLLTTDADCVMGSDWLAQAVELQKIHSGTEIFILPVIVEINDTEISQWQNIESIQLLALTEITASLHVPVLCSGANLMFRKRFYERALTLRNDLHIASGDDLFLLEQASSVKFFASAALKVTTRSAENIKSFAHQRVRWFGKVTKLRRPRFFIIGSAVGVWQFAIPAILLWILLLRSPVYAGIIFIMIKLWVDLTLQYRISRRLRLQFDFLRGLMFSLTYPMIQFGILLAGIFIVPVWKGRPIQS